jgi:undecaprenyl diphosphate synthase
VTVPKGIDPKALPAHVAMVMDGNGRWAKERGLPRTAGHEAGELALFDAIEGGLEIGLKWMTIYAFSTENWNRPKTEVRFLMNFNREILHRRRDELDERGVRMRFMGRRDWRLPRGVLREMEIAEEQTRRNRKMTLTVGLNYGGRQEIVDAVKKIVEDRDAGKLGRITSESISARMYYPDMPEPDLIIRTSGEQRVSNFLLWESAYSEFWFTPVPWPEFNRELLFDAVRDYQKRSRRFGGLEA